MKDSIYYDLSIDELDRAFLDFDEYVESNGGWNFGEARIVSAFIDFIEYGSATLEERDGQ